MELWRIVITIMDEGSRRIEEGIFFYYQHISHDKN